MLGLQLYATKLAVWNIATLTRFFASMISNLFYDFGKQKMLQSRVKGLIPKKWLQVRTRRLSMFGRVGLKNTFLFQNQSAILFQSLWFHPKKLDYWLSFLVMEVRRQDKQDIHLIRYSI